jgi:hypothetical protein
MIWKILVIWALMSLDLSALWIVILTLGAIITTVYDIVLKN